MIFDNLDIELEDLIQMSPADKSTIAFAVEDKVREYCKEHSLDFDDVEHEYGVSVSINIFKK